MCMYLCGSLCLQSSHRAPLALRIRGIVLCSLLLCPYIDLHSPQEDPERSVVPTIGLVSDFWLVVSRGETRQGHCVEAKWNENPCNGSDVLLWIGKHPPERPTILPSVPYPAAKYDDSLSMGIPYQPSASFPQCKHSDTQWIQWLRILPHHHLPYCQTGLIIRAHKIKVQWAHAKESLWTPWLGSQIPHLARGTCCSPLSLPFPTLANLACQPNWAKLTRLNYWCQLCPHLGLTLSVCWQTPVHPSKPSSWYHIFYEAFPELYSDSWSPPPWCYPDTVDLSLTWLSSHTVIFPTARLTPWQKGLCLIPFLTLTRHLLGAQWTVVEFNSLLSLMSICD